MNIIFEKSGIYGDDALCSKENAEIAAVTYDDRTASLYRYDSEKFNVHIILKTTYLKALEESRDITSELLSKER